MSFFKLSSKQLPITLLSVVAFWSCVSKEKSTLRTSEDLEFLKASVAAKKLQPCTIQSNVSIPANPRAAKLLWQGTQPILVYEAAFREAIKTVWQPLTPALQLNGDGVVVGQKGSPFVTDFVPTSDAFGNLWTSYRAKSNSSEIFSAVVEFLDRSKANAALSRIVLPTPANTTVQQIWLVAAVDPANGSQLKGMAHVVVKTTPTTFSSNDKSEVNYFWFGLNAPQNQARKMGEYRDTSLDTSSVSFAVIKELPEPILIAITNSSSDDEATNPKLQKRTSQIVARRIFSKQPLSSLVLHESEGILGALALSTDTQNATGQNLHLTWVKEPQADGKSFIEMADTRLDFTETKPEPAPSPTKRKAKKAATPKKGTPHTTPRESKATHSTPAKEKVLTRTLPFEMKKIQVDYQPARLEFFNLPVEANKHIASVGWWAATDTDFAYVLSPVGQKTTTPSTLAFYPTAKAGRPLGIGVPADAQNGQFTLLFASGSLESRPDEPSVIRFCSAANTSVP